MSYDLADPYDNKLYANMVKPLFRGASGAEWDRIDTERHFSKAILVKIGKSRREWLAWSEHFHLLIWDRRMRGFVPQDLQEPLFQDFVKFAWTETESQEKPDLSESPETKAAYEEHDISVQPLHRPRFRAGSGNL